ncbi:low-specificity L-threonine aldolase [Clostridium sp. 'deep sea']|uniref:low-specificity L-threonine aldolase n=1 Tax=Clostridium sp. 'deep sea' TaxID=2779445 RepID=UPI0018969D42|nr:low-specificity L-threonine aldolase [Clostridium sp. 'deep sea']QOR35693.1 low-specificity L-threonine aldolase [Clostridium sp. 'deep sea']
MRNFIDLRSDTVTKPTEEMRLAMYRAEVGDDVYRDDPTVNRLEALGAEMLKKEAALFVTSGTQGNLLALLSHCNRSNEVILEANSHIYLFEVGGIAGLAGLNPRCIEGVKGFIDPQKIEKNIRTENVHFPETKLICIENTHNLAGGTVISLEQQLQVKKIADKHNLKLHLDGARAFNGATSLNCDISEFVKPYDSVQLCLSKGLGAPIGGLLLGSKEFIAKARRYRKMVGGGMRQAGIVAAAGIYALENNINRLKQDHDNALLLAKEVSEIKGLNVNLSDVHSNIVFCDVDKKLILAATLCQKLKDKGVLFNDMGNNKIRLVTHLDVTEQDCVKAAHLIKQVMNEL